MRKKNRNIIEGQGITYNYLHYDEDGKVDSAQLALDHVDLDVEAGQFIAILGHNGSGKSTLAKQINALLLPGEGTLYVDGNDTRDESKLWEIRQCAGMVFQNPDNQIIASVVEEDVGFGPENMGVPTKQIWERAERALRAVDMWKYRGSSPNRLSGGQKTVRELNRKEGITVILITHYMEEVIHADRVIVMDSAKVVMTGTPREIFSQVEKLRELRLGVPQVTELAWELKKAGLPLPDGILTIEEFTKALDRVRGRSGAEA